MKKLLCLPMMIGLILLTSCAGTADWSFKLPNDYELWHINSKEIIVKYTGDKAQIEEIPSFVKEFAFNEKYVFTRNVDSIEKNNIFTERYYILDTESNVLFGPFEDKKEIETKSAELKTSIPETWYRTSPDPNTSVAK